MRFSPLLLALPVIALSACKLKVNTTVTTNGRQITAHGITYVVPWESSSHDDINGFAYKGDSVTAAVKDGSLTVDGKSYGTVKAGDTVDLTTKGTVLINGQVRASP